MIRRARDRIGVVALWGVASLAAAAGHAAVAAIALNLSAADPAPYTAPPVVMIDLAPAAPQLPQQQAAPGPQAAESVPEPDAPPPEVVDSMPALPKLPEKEQAVALLPPPMPQPRPEAKPAARTPDKTEEHKKLERRVASHAAAPAAFDSPRSQRASAPAAGAARIPPAISASWKNDLMAALNRHKRYPSGTDSTGTALVAFSINRAGEVTSARLVRTSGDHALDQEAVALPRRASPLPKPPEGVGAATIVLTVPIRFGRN